MLEFRPTMKNVRNSVVEANVPFWLTSGPQLPASRRAHTSSTIIQIISIGAHQCSIF